MKCENCGQELKGRETDGFYSHKCTVTRNPHDLRDRLDRMTVAILVCPDTARLGYKETTEAAAKQIAANDAWLAEQGDSDE